VTESTPVETFDQASLESFTTSLVAAGFEPVPHTARRKWLGPLHASLKPLADARHMQIVIRDGWPVVFPYLFVDGLHSNHLTVDGYVCLWHEGDASREWANVEGLFDRIAKWAESARDGWDPAGLARDAQLNFTKKIPVVATFDIDEFSMGAAGRWVRFMA
jgi:GrpB-like predicted nucleotidyltransferase (UPF0157 family)